MKSIMLIIMFFAIGALFIISQNNLNMNSGGDFKAFSGIYTSWIDSLLVNFRGVSGYIVKMDWLPENSSR